MANNSRPRAMQIVSVRYGADQIRVIQDEAEAEGVSASQFIRDSSFARAVMLAARRNRNTALMWDRLIAVVESAGHDALSGELRDLLETAEAIDRDDPPA